MLSASGQNSVPRPGDGHDYIHLLNETVNPGSGSVNLKIDIPQPPGKGFTLPFSISYNSGGVWQAGSGGDGESEIRPSIDSGAPGGWSYSTARLTYKNVMIHYDPSPADNAYEPGTVPDAAPGGTTCTWTTDYVFYDPSGQPHPLGIGALTVEPNEIVECPRPTGYTTPGTGISVVPDGGDNFVKAHLSVPWPVNGINDSRHSQVTTADGTTYTFDGGGIFASGATSPGQAGFQIEFPSTITDRNGNTATISVGAGSNRRTISTDSAGRITPVGTVQGGPTANDAGVLSNELDTMPVSGLAAPYQIQWKQLSASGPSIYGTLLSTDFPGCSQNPNQLVGAFNGNRIPMGIGKITLPNGQSYTFDYDNATGLLSTIVYPNGAVVTYQWGMQSNFNQSVLSHVVQGDTYVFSAYTLGVGGSTGGPFATDPNINDVSFPCAYAYNWPAITSRTISFKGDITHPDLSQTFSYVTMLSGTQPMTRTTTVTTNDIVQGTTTKKVYQYSLSPTNDNDPYAFDAPQYGMSGLGQETMLAGPLSQPPIWTLPLEQSVMDEDNAGNVLRTVTKTWGGDIHQWGAEPDQLRSETTTQGGNTTSTHYDYISPDSISKLSLPSDTTEIGYDGSQLITHIDYQPFAGTAQPYQYQFGPSIFDRPLHVITSTANTANSKVSETDYDYHDASGNLDVSGNARTVTQKCWQASGLCTDHTVQFTYDPSGLVHTSTQMDPFGTTTYDRSSSYNNAYITTITYPPTNGIAHVENFTYDFPSGRLTGARDENSNWTYYIYKDAFGNPDPLGRLLETDYPEGGGKTTIVYNDVGSSPTVTVSRLDGPTSVSVMDGIGHVVQTQQVGTSSTSNVDTVYDGNGRVASVTNPHFLNTSTSDGITSFYYDPLGRKKYQCQPDNGRAAIPCQPGNSYLWWQYASDTSIHDDVTTFTDEVGNPTARTTDAFGRLMQVSEPGGLLTKYSYDPLGNLTNVHQLGNGSTDVPRTRSFTYDSLSQLIASNNPENTGMSLPAQLNCVPGGPWTTCYTYDGNGNLHAKTDNRNITTTYLYDALNRVTSKTYSNDGTGTLPSCYSYDTAIKGIGKLASEWTKAGVCPLAAPASGFQTKRSFLAYDLMGRLLNEQQCFLTMCTSGPPPPSGCAANGNSAPYFQTYCYDRAGNMTWYVNGTSNVPGVGSIAFMPTFDAGRLSGVTSSWNDSLHPSPLLTVDPTAGYTPANALQKFTLGNHILLQKSYDNRLRTTSETAITQ